MKNFKRVYGFVILVLMAAFLMTGCAGKTKDLSRQTAKPDWVKKGSCAVKDGKDQAFYGVGSAWGIKNPSLMRTTSENRARAEISKVFNFYTASLVSDFQMSAMAGNVDKTTEEVHTEETMKIFTKAKLSGVMIIDHWMNRDTGQFFSLACMKLSEFEGFMKNAEELSETLRKRVLEHSEKAFEKLEKEEQRHE